MTGSITERLTRSAEILAMIEEKRRTADTPTLGASIERYIVQSQLAELEAEIEQNPGALEPWIRVSRGPAIQQ
jgi:hypothetical protein